MAACRTLTSYLPEDWAEDAMRARRLACPAPVTFASKSEIALAQLQAAKVAGITPGIVLADDFIDTVNS